jgi:glycopeptide antibiotics resistance protein
VDEILSYALWAMQIISFVGIIYVPVAFLLRKKLSPPRLIAVFLFLSWAIVVLYVTVFGTVAWGTTVFRPGRIPAMINPFPTMMAWFKHSDRIAGQLLLNMLMFMPIGFLMPMVLKNARKAGRAFCSVLLFTLLIEGSQYLLGTRAADMADIVMNAFGGMAGYIIFRAFDFLLKNNALWKSFCKPDTLPYSTQPQRTMSIGKTAVAYSVIFALAISSCAFFTQLRDLKTSSYSQTSADGEEQRSSGALYEIENDPIEGAGTYQPTEEDIQIDRELQEARERNIAANRKMWEDAKEKGIKLPAGSGVSANPADIAGYPIERPSFGESQLRQIFEAYEDFLLTKPDYFEPYFEPYDANTVVAAERSLDPRINTLLYDPDVDRENGILKDYQIENLYAKEAPKKTGEYTTVILGKTSASDKWEVIFEGSYYELRAEVL